MNAVLEDMNVNVKLKISALWIAVMFLFIYVDYFALYIPGIIVDLLAGETGGLPIDQIFLILSLSSMMIPSLMIFLSLALKAKVNRWLNIIVGAVFSIAALAAIVMSLLDNPSVVMINAVTGLVWTVLVVWIAWKSK